MPVSRTPTRLLLSAITAIAIASVLFFVLVEHFQIWPDAGSLFRFYTMIVMYILSLPGILVTGWPLSDIHYLWAVVINLVFWTVVLSFLKVVLAAINTVVGASRRSTSSPKG